MVIFFEWKIKQFASELVLFHAIRQNTELKFSKWRRQDVIGGAKMRWRTHNVMVEPLKRPEINKFTSEPKIIYALVNIHAKRWNTEPLFSLSNVPRLPVRVIDAMYMCRIKIEMSIYVYRVNRECFDQSRPPTNWQNSISEVKRGTLIFKNFALRAAAKRGA